ncbi:MAG: hypothetical protein OHK0046_49310 [Anaerolineae bacterium]
MPDLDALARLFDVIAQWEQAGSNPEGLLNQTLPVVQSALPEVQAMRLYTAVGQNLFPTAATDASTTANGLTVADALQAQNPTSTTEGQIWQFPLQDHAHTFGLLEVSVQGALTAPRWLQLAAERVAQGLLRQINVAFQQAHQAATAALVRATTAQEIAGAIGQHILDRGQFVSIILLQFDSEKNLIGFKTLASANREEAFKVDAVVALTMDDLGDLGRHMLVHGEPIILENMQNIEGMANLIKTWNDTVPILSACALPLRDSSGVFGLIGINNVRGVLNVPPQKLALLQILADQVAIMLRSLQAAEQSQQTKAIADQLLYTNRAISSSDNDSEMSWSILQAMPREIVMTAIVLFDNPTTGEDMPGAATLAVVTTRDSILHPDVRDVFPPGDEHLPTIIHEMIDGQIRVMENSRTAPYIALPNATRYLNDLGVYSFVSVGLRSGRRLLGFLMFGSPQSVRSSTSHFDNVLAVADQVAVTVENRNLLRQMETSLEEIRLLYTVNRDLIQSRSEIDVLRVLRKHLAGEASSIYLVTLEWSGDRLASLVPTWLIDERGREIGSDRNMIGTITPERMEQLKAEWALQGHEVDVIEDLADILQVRPVSQLSYDSGIRSMVVIPVYDGQKLVQQVGFNYPRPRQFDSQTRRLFDAIRDQITIVLQNQRLLRETQRAMAGLGSRVRVLQTINEVSAQLVAAPDEQALLDLTCEVLYQALQVDHVGVVLNEARGESTFGTIVSEFPLTGVLGQQVENSAALQARLRQQRNPVIINQVEDHQQFTAATREVLEQVGAKSIMLVPLIDVQNHYMGSIGLDMFSAERSFDTEMADIALAITTQVAVSLQNLRLLRDAQRQARQMEDIASLSRSVQSTLDLPRLLEIALNNAANILSFDYICVVLYDLNKNEPRLAAYRESGDLVYFETDTIHAAADFANSTLSHVWHTKAPLVIDDLPADDSGLRHLVREDMRSVVGVPLFARGVVIGVVEAASRMSYAYPQVDTAIFQQFVSQIAVALENVEAYLQSQRVARSKATASEITSLLQRRIEIEQLLGVTMNELGHALQARRARIRINPDAIPRENGKKS